MNALTDMELDPGSIAMMIESLPDDERAEFMTLMQTLNERLFYQMNPIQWIEDKLGIKKHTIKWSLNEGYAALDEGPRVMDDGEVIDNDGTGWDGTRNPLSTALEALAEWKNVALQSSTGTGKTFLAALVTLWFLDVFPNSKVFTVAPKKEQLESNLWGEIDKFKEIFRDGNEEKSFMHLEIRLTKSWFAKGMVAAVRAGEEVSSKMAGAHAEHMLWIIDETQGVDSAIIQAIQNTCTAPHNLRLYLGNPRHKEDQLHKMYLKKSNVSVRVSSYDHPNIVMNDPDTDLRGHKMIVPGAVSWGSIHDRRELYGPEPKYYNNNATYKALVRGYVPAGAELSLFTEKALDMIDSYLEENPPIPVYEKIHQPRDHKVLEGFTRIYYNPEHTHRNRYVFFADVAEDAGNGDWHACVVLDRVLKKIVALIHMRGHRVEYVKEILKVADMFKVYDPELDGYSMPVVNWEKNAGGALHLVTEFNDYPNLFVARTYENEDQQTLKKKVKGWVTHVKTRTDMINELQDWGYTLVTNFAHVPDEAVLKEMKTFVWSEKRRRFEHMPGHHDDIMMALSGSLISDRLLPDPQEIDFTKIRHKSSHTNRISDIQRKLNRMKRRNKRGETPWDRARV